MAQTRVSSELNANVWKLLVAVGDPVEADQELLILESMKTEIPVTAPKAGRVSEILVEEGQIVSERQALLVLDT
jgi:acetyl-CoA carboxylase biotin carboxyl carrier protein